jgi:serine/threonine protein kinase
VKPSNIMIDGSENLYLVDFGLASCRQLGTAGQKEKGTVMGTPAYMPTEQARGEINRVGPWSDQYGAGVVLFHMLTGALPYQDANPYAVISQAADYNFPPKRPREIRPDLDAELEELVLKAMRKFPGERFDSCAEFADRLQAWIDKQKQTAPAPLLRPEAPPRPSRGRWIALAVAAVVLVAVSLLTLKLIALATRPSSPTFFVPTKKPNAP